MIFELVLIKHLLSVRKVQLDLISKSNNKNTYDSDDRMSTQRDKRKTKNQLTCNIWGIDSVALTSMQ